MLRTPARAGALFVVVALVAVQPSVAAPPSDAALVVVRLAPGVPISVLGPDAVPMVPPGRADRLRAAAGRMGRSAPDLTRWAIVRTRSAAAARRLQRALVHRRGVRSARAAGPPPPPGPAQQCRAIPASFGVAPVAAPPLGQPLPDLSAFDDTRRYMEMNSLPTGGDGAGVRVADVEYEWDTAHIELADRNLPAPVRPLATPLQNISHGTAALALIGGRDDGQGITGLAPAVDLYPVGPWSAGAYNPAAGIAAAADMLRPGDVLLVEQQSRLRGPADTGDYGAPVAAAIAAATAKGLVVVLPAGNGGRDLQEYGQPATDTAIVVGGGEFPEGDGVLAARHPQSNTGARIDVQGPAHSVVTATASPSYYGFLVGGTTAPSRSYTHCFNGTSSASAAVAGAIAAMQGVARANLGRAFTPAEVLQRLTSTGLPQPDPEGGRVGPLPRVASAADVVPPVAPVLGIAAGARVAAGSARLTWTSGDDPAGGSGRGADAVLVDGRELARVPAGTGELALTLSPGPHRVAVRSFDVAGNTSETAVDVEAVDPSQVGAYSAPPPPGTSRVNSIAAARVLSARWDRRRGLLTIRLRPAPGARATVAAQPVALRAGVLTARVRRPGVRLVVVRADGFRTLRLRVRVDGAGRVTVTPR